MTSNVTEFYKQSRQVLPEKPTGLVSKAREYCLQLPRVWQALLACPASVAHEPYLCGSLKLYLCFDSYRQNKRRMHQLYFGTSVLLSNFDYIIV